MSDPITTPVKAPSNYGLMVESNSSTPQSKSKDDGSDGENEMLVGSFSALKVTQCNYLAKRCADSFTIEGSPVNVNIRFKRQDIHPTPLKASFYGGIDSDDTPLPRVPAIPTLLQVEKVVEPFTHEPNDRFVVAPTEDKLLVICSASEEHNTGDHQENALRTALLCGSEGCLRRPELNQYIEWIDSDNLTGAPLADLLRVHEYTYLKYLEDKCKAAASPSTANRLQLPPFYAPPGMLDADTPLQPQSLNAAKRFCGAAILAVDHVMAGRSEELPGPATSANEERACNRAFVIGRPPGHHAGPHGCVPSAYFWQRPDMASSGFCLLNTVAVAAAYARHQYGRWAWRNTCLGANPITTGTGGATASGTKTHTIGGGGIVGCSSGTGKSGGGSGGGANGGGANGGGANGGGGWRAPRIAIVDIDIHHGNGTEEIVRNLSPRMVHLPLPSSWAPVTTLSYKPWLNEQDQEEVFFSSVHLYAGDRFYPCSGPDSFPADAPPPATASQTSGMGGVESHEPGSSGSAGGMVGVPPPAASTAPLTEEPSSERIVNIALTPVGPGPWDRKGRAKLTLPQRELLCKQASAEFRHKVTSMLLPRLEAFNADLLFISAGFDAHFDDFYHFLTEQDLHWVTEQLCAVADRSGTFGCTEGEAARRKCGVISVLEGGYSLSSPLPKPKATRTAAATSATAASVPAAVFPAGLTAAAADISSGQLGSPPDASAGQLGRGGRLKAKKEKPLAGAGIVPVSSNTASVPLSVEASENKISTVQAPAVAASAAVKSEDTKFAQRPGDGGLVKGVLAHAAALVGQNSWVV